MFTFIIIKIKLIDKMFIYPLFESYLAPRAICPSLLVHPSYNKISLLCLGKDILHNRTKMADSAECV